MPITADDIKQQIILEVGDIAPGGIDPPVVPEDGLLFRNIDVLWRTYAAKDVVAPGLRALYTKRACLRMVLAQLGRRVFDVSDVLAGLTMKANAVWTHYWDLHECAKGEIKDLEQRYGLSAAYRGGALTRTAPITPRHPPDGNALRYGGSPYTRRRSVR